MANRFRKSIKLAAGVRWNVGGPGSSWRFGPRGSTVSVGKRHPASAGPAATPTAPASQSSPLKLTCSVSDEGDLAFTDASGQPLPEQLLEQAKKQSKEGVVALIQPKCDEINRGIEALGRLHHDTPDPRVKPAFVAEPFPVAEPSVDPPQRLSMIDKLVASRRQRVEEANRAALERHQQAMEAWRLDKVQFEQQQAARKELLETLIYEDAAAMESFVEERLQEIVWPRETLLTLEVVEDGQHVKFDVELPELEDMPTRLAVVPARGLKLSAQHLTTSKVQKLYAEHVHGIMFRLVGEVFAALPTVERVTASGYSRRKNPDPAVTQLRDEYLLSLRVMRHDWETLDFEHLEAIDVTEVLARYDLKQETLRTGRLKSIRPIV